MLLQHATTAVSAAAALAVLCAGFAAATPAAHHLNHYSYDFGGAIGLSGSGSNNYVTHNHHAPPHLLPVSSSAATNHYQHRAPLHAHAPQLPVTALLFANHDHSIYEPVPLPPPPPSLPVIPLSSPTAAHKTPLNIMVDISNRLAFAVLNAHTEPHSVRRRAQNFAYSPCGLTSVLIALWEGAAGSGGGYEIYRAMRLPWDRDVVRVGVRDMHKRLREYFYAEENLLDGLSLSQDNVTIRPEYEAVLRFYGYDLNPSVGGEEMINMATTMFHVATDGPSVATATTRTTAPPPITFTSVTATAVTRPVTTTDIVPVATSTMSPPDTTILPETTTAAAVTTTEAITTTTTEVLATTTSKVTTTIVTTTQPPPTTTTTATEPPTTTTLAQTTTALPSTTTEWPTTTTNPLPPPTTTTNAPVDTTPVFVPLIAQRVTTVLPPLTPTSTPEAPTPFVPLIAQRVPTIVATTEKLDSTTPYVFTYKPISVPATTSRTSRAFTTMPTTYATDLRTSTAISTLPTTVISTMPTITASVVNDVKITTSTTETASTTQIELLDQRQRRARFRSASSAKSAIYVTPLINRQARRFPMHTTTTAMPPSSAHKRVKKFLHYNRKYFDLLNPFQRHYSPSQYTSLSSDLLSKLHPQCCSSIYYATPNPPTYQHHHHHHPVPNYSQSTYYQPTHDEDFGTSAAHFDFPPPPPQALAHPTVTTASTTTTTRLPQSLVGLSFSSYASASADDNANAHRNSASSTVDSSTDANTTQLPFHIDPRLTVTAPHRILTAPLRLGYATALQASVLELPLDSDQYVLLLMLPDVAFDLNGLMQRMAAANRVAPTVREIRSSMRTFWIRATVPLVQLKGSAVLTGDMMKLGVKDIFEPARADFTPMTDETGIYAKHIEQLITLNIQTSSGHTITGGGAASSDSTNNNRPSDSSLYNPIEVNVQQPFVFCIVDKENDLIIMIGQIVNPLSSRIL